MLSTQVRAQELEVKRTNSRMEWYKLALLYDRVGSYDEGTSALSKVSDAGFKIPKDKYEVTKPIFGENTHFGIPTGESLANLHPFWILVNTVVFTNRILWKDRFKFDVSGKVDYLKLASAIRPTYPFCEAAGYEVEAALLTMIKRVFGCETESKLKEEMGSEYYQRTVGLLCSMETNINSELGNNESVYESYDIYDNELQTWQCLFTANYRAKIKLLTTSVL